MLKEAQDNLISMGINNNDIIIYNPSYEILNKEESLETLEGYELSYKTDFNCPNVLTGKFTGRSPKDKYIVKDNLTNDKIWWNTEKYPNDNKPISQDIWAKLKKITEHQLSNKKLFVLDMFCGANTNTRLSIRFVTEVAWQAHFVKNMFIEPNESELENFLPDFYVLNSSKATNPNWQEDGLNSENFIAFNLTEKTQIIGGSWYGGEMKKGIFALMNYILPQKNIASMHCSANADLGGKNSAIYFGLSGTGKTTLSNDPDRYLVGDDEHGWDDEGIFNFEGGCYAKTSRLTNQSEPMIFNAIKENALLENVKLIENHKVDFDDTSLTENGRVSYPINHIEKRIKLKSVAEHPTNIIFLSADATGVLPPLSCLSHEQAIYYYLSGYTSKAIGTEMGLTETQATFSSCFGAAFLTLHPIQYAEVFENKILKHNPKIYLINTGWNGKKERLSLEKTRNIINQINMNSIKHDEFLTIPYFNLKIPNSLLKDDLNFYDPRLSFNEMKDWDINALKLAEKFNNNFQKFKSVGSAMVDKYSSFGPKI